MTGSGRTRTPRTHRTCWTPQTVTPISWTPTGDKWGITQMLLDINWCYWQPGKNSRMRRKVQSRHMQARFIKIRQVFAKINKVGYFSNRVVCLMFEIVKIRVWQWTGNLMYKLLSSVLLRAKGIMKRHHLVNYVRVQSWIALVVGGLRIKKKWNIHSLTLFYSSWTCIIPYINRTIR